MERAEYSGALSGTFLSAEKTNAEIELNFEIISDKSKEVAESTLPKFCSDMILV
jgi:hypothetical protein